MNERGECSCGRCGRPCRVAGPGRPDAVWFRLADRPAGQCIDCHVTEFLLNTYPVNMDLDEHGPDCLRDPGMQRLFGDIIRTANGDASPDEIDWEQVITNWDLPVTIDRKNPRNPYLPVHPRRAKPDERYLPHCNAWRSRPTKPSAKAKSAPEPPAKPPKRPPDQKSVG